MERSKDIDFFASVKVRACPGLTLVVRDQLSAADQDAFAAWQGKDSVYGVLVHRSRQDGAPIAVSPEVALLFLTLTEPATVPRYAQERFGRHWRHTIEKLVLDGVLEIQTGTSFVCGAAALPLLSDSSSAQTLGQGGMAQCLSRSAVEYAAHLDLADPLALSLRMYHYNRIPWTREWNERYGSPEAVMKAWGAPVPGCAGLPSHWSAQRLQSADDPWAMWDNRKADSRGSATRKAGLKLYVSPAPDQLGNTFVAVRECLTSSRAVAFKVGRYPSSVLRPDKLVMYFSDLADMQQTAEQLSKRLAGTPAHGVPFTADISGDGLLSWGADPPREKHTGATEQESWRLWVTNGLALALTAARSSGTIGPERARFAVERLAREGVDPATWAPAQTIWN